MASQTAKRKERGREKERERMKVRERDNTKIEKTEILCIEYGV